MGEADTAATIDDLQETDVGLNPKIMAENCHGSNSESVQNDAAEPACRQRNGTMNQRPATSQTSISNAVRFGLASRIWQLLAGLVTAVLVTGLFSADLQGYYYTFARLLAMQTFVELGLHAIIIYFVSHDWARLKLDESGAITGDPDSLSRLVTFGRKLFRWYGGVAALFVLIVGLTGVIFFWPGDPEIDWISPWMVLVVLTACSLWLIPFISILEGCNQVESVNRFRFWLAVVANLAVWPSLIMGAGLWAIAVSGLVKLVGELFLLGGVYRNFFRVFRTPQGNAHFPWKEEVWPMQWRSAVQSIAGYFGLAFVTVVMFKCHSPALGGQVGLTCTLLLVVQGLGQAWIQPSVPTIGVLISQRDFSLLNRMFRRLLIVSSSLVLAGSVGFAGVIWALKTWQLEISQSALPAEMIRILTRLTERIIDPGTILIFGIGVTCSHVVTCQGIYIRAHRKDPMLVLSTTSNVLTGIAIYLLGRFYAETGAAIGYSAVLLLVALPGHLHFMRVVRSCWHQSLEAPELVGGEADQPTDTSDIEH